MKKEFSYLPHMWAVYTSPDGGYWWGLHSIHWRRVNAQEMRRMAEAPNQKSIVKKVIVTLSVENWRRK